jgi:hypothetical protein
MPHRAEEIRTAHLLDVMNALRVYTERGHEIALETSFIAKDRGAITLTLDLSEFHPLLTELMNERFGIQYAPQRDGATRTL